MPSGTGVPSARAADQARDRTTLGVVAADRHVPQFASRPGALAIQVDVGALHGQAAGEQRGRIGPVRAAEDVDARHLGVLGRGGPERQVEHGPHVVLELRRDRALHRPVARVVGSGRHLVDQQPAARPEELDGHDADAAGDLGHLLAEGRGGLEDVGVQPSRHEHLPADPAHLGRLHRRPGRRRARGAPGHHDGQLGVEREQLLDDDLASNAVEHGRGLRSIGDGPHALAVVAAPGRLHHDGPAVRGGEAPRRRRARRGPPPRRGRRGRARPPRRARSRMRALSTASSSVAAPGRTTAPCAASSATSSRSTCSWSKVRTSQRSGERAEIGGHEGRAEHHLGRHVAGGIVGALGQDRHGEAQRAGRLTGHAGQLASADEPDRVGAQVARPRAGIRLDSGADTTGRLREEHQGHGQAAAHREHD